MVIRFYKILILGCIFCNVSCNSQNKIYDDNPDSNILGKYIKNNHPYKNPNYEEITISKDSVKYKLSLELYGKHVISGIWKLKKDTLCLSFNFSAIEKKGGLSVKFESKKHKNISISFKDTEGKVLDGSIVYMNNNQYLLNLKPLEMKAQFIDFIKVNYFGQFYEIKIAKYIDSNVVIILEPKEVVQPIYEFVKTKWLIRDNRLILLKENIVDENYFLDKR